MGSCYRYMQKDDCPLQLAKIVCAAYGFLLLVWLGNRCTSQELPETMCFRVLAMVVLVCGAWRAAFAREDDVKDCPEYSVAVWWLSVPTVIIALQVILVILQCCWLVSERASSR